MKKTFFARYSWFIILVVTFLAPINLGGSLRALRTNKQDFKEWLPASFAETADYEWFSRYFPGEQFVLMSWDGCTLDNTTKLDAFATKLRHRINNPPEGEKSNFGKVQTGKELVDDLTHRLENSRGFDAESARAEAINRLKGSLIGIDGNQTCLVVTISDVGVDRLREAVGEIYTIAEQECAIDQNEIHAGGPPIDNLSIELEGEKTLYQLAGLVGLAGLVVAWWCVRSWQLVFIVLFSAVYCAGISLAIVWFAGWKMNAVVMSMPSLVYVLTISGAIHIVNYYRDAIEEVGIERAPGQAIKHGFRPCLIATVTTAIGLGSLYVSPIHPIKAFGLFSALGTLAALPILFLYIPAALEILPLKVDRKKATAADAVDPNAGPRSFDAFWTGVGAFVVKRHAIVACCCLAVMGIVGYGLTRTTTSVSLMKLLSPDVKLAQDYRWLESELGPLVPMELVLTVDDEKCKLSMLERMELVERIEQEVHKFDEIGATMSAVTFAPPLPDPVPAGTSWRDPRRIRRNVTNQKLIKYRSELTDGGYLADDAETELWRVTARMHALDDTDYGLFVHDLKARVEPILTAYRNAGVEGIDIEYTGIVPLIYKVQRETLSGLVESMVLAFGLIAIVMIGLFRGVLAGFLSMIPNVFPAVMIFGLIGWSGNPVDIGAMMTASVALGVAVDDTVHFMNWFRDGLRQGMDRRGAVMLAYRMCAGAMTQTSLIGGIGLGVFALSNFTPTQTFGIMMPSMLGAALVGDLLLLPAMLVGPLGYFFSKGVKPREATPEPETDVVSEVIELEPHVHALSTPRSMRA